MTMKIAFVYKSKGYKRDFTIIQRVHCDCKGYCTLHKKHRENTAVGYTVYAVSIEFSILTLGMPVHVHVHVLHVHVLWYMWVLHIVK